MGHCQEYHGRQWKSGTSWLDQQWGLIYIYIWQRYTKLQRHSRVKRNYKQLLGVVNPCCMWRQHTWNILVFQNTCRYVDIIFKMAVEIPTLKSSYDLSVLWVSLWNLQYKNGILRLIYMHNQSHCCGMSVIMIKKALCYCAANIFTKQSGMYNFWGEKLLKPYYYK